MFRYLTVLLIITGIMITGCKGETMQAKNSVDFNVSKDDFSVIAKKKILFGHRSVGENILNGVKSLPDSGVLSITETRAIEDFNVPVFAHTGIGKNTDPVSKIDDFKSVVTALNGNLDIAFMKFCYIDISTATDVKKLFAQYKQAIDELQAQFPQVIFVHCTVPLMTIESGVKARIKTLLGKSLWGQDDNVARGNFNTMLVNQYPGKVFDLARLESTFADGSRAVFIRNGQQYGYLIGAYASDEGHLNNTGSEFVAKALIKFLSGLK